MLTINKYLKSIGQSNRRLCLIPKSAHGTNPATAAMCGMEIIVVDSDEHGNVNVDDLKQKAIANKD